MATTTEAERILVLAPTPGDAEISRSVLGDAGLGCHLCANVAEVASQMLDGAGAILLTPEVLSWPDSYLLAEALQRQPAWSDIPIIMLCTSGADSAAAAMATELLGNITVLERPVRVTTLVSALHTAVRARRRQYELRDHLDELHRADTSLRRQTSRLRLLWESASVLLTSEDPEAMMRTLFYKIAPHFGLDAFLSFVCDDGGEALRLEASEGVEPELQERLAHLPMSTSICGAVARQRQPMAFSYIQHTNDPLLENVRQFGFQAYACTPMMADDKLLGALAFASRQRVRFDLEEIEFLETITRYVTSAYERVRLIDELRDTDRRKDEFLATLAHELRNPLAPIRNALHIMSLTQGDPGASEQARTMMERQLAQMVRLIDDLLDVSRITRGKLELRKERVELGDIIKNAVDTARPSIDAAHHELELEVAPYPIHLDADPVRLAQVFSNLLNNAAKYMDPGGKIWLTCRHYDHKVTVSVRDAGIGIPAPALRSIFDMFTQVERSLEKSQGGLGIGLTLVKRLVEMHGGSVEARSEGVGRGSEFCVTLPVATAAEAAPPRPSRRPPAQRKSCRILVADDNRDAAESMGMMLRLMGNDVRTVHDGIEAVEEAATFRPDVVLLDIGMPRLNGYEAARRIRQERWGKSMHLVALTGWGQQEDKSRASEAGFDRHFTKPMDPGELERIVAGLGTTLRHRARETSAEPDAEA
ncbi:MAG TPA: ATP-binding protein [Candidatus Limnocylindrales bacterium]|nr:ATP-binding protein [Candidatus Limnocylindrales bacterium]